MSSGSQSVTLPSGEQLPYSLERRDVARPRITLNPDGTIEAVVPPEALGHTLISRERDWITSEYRAQQAKLAKIRSRYGELTEQFTLWGKSYQLVERTGCYNLNVATDTIRVTTPDEVPAEQYLYSQLREALAFAVRTIATDYCKQLETSFSKLFIRLQRTKWASCSSGDTLNFNLRCAFLPIEHLRYLVAHEVSHLQEPDHTEEFWQFVESLVPAHQSRRDELQGFWYAVHHNDQWRQILSQDPP